MESQPWAKSTFGGTLARLRTLDELDRFRSFVAVKHHDASLTRRNEPAIMAPMPGLDHFAATLRARKVPAETVDYLRATYRYPLLSRGQEFHLSRRLNYAKHRMAAVLDGPRQLFDRDIVERFYAVAVEDRQLFVACNVRMLIKVVRKFRRCDEEDLFSFGQVLLVQLADRYNPFHGTRFTTFAWGTLYRDLAKYVHRESRRDMTGADLASIPVDTSDLDDADDVAGQVDADRETMADLMLDLTPRERTVLRSRIGAEGAPLSFSEIAQRIGTSKRRANQIYGEAIAKLRQAKASVSLFDGVETGEEE